MADEQRVFALPDVGEGLTEAEVLRWLVRPGDTVIVNQVIVEIETAKAAVELPSPFAGTVTELLVAEGTVVPVGSPLIAITTRSPAGTDTPARQAVLVGYGVREDAPTARRPRRATTGTEPIESDGPAAEPVRKVRAKPLVRRLARERGIDLASVAPTGPGGEVTRRDVLGTTGSETAREAAVRESPGERIPVRGVQRAMAEAMVQSAFSAPHVTEWVDVDMTRSLELITRLRAGLNGDDVRITPMTLVAAGLIRAARQYPRINSTWIDTAEGADVMIHREVHLGIAADTPRGLLVPSVKEASSLGLVELARRVQVLIDTARAGRSTSADLTGGTITLTNVGVFGVDGGTPILVPGQSSILAMGRILERAWVVSGAVVPRPVMTLTLSFDHRVVDGALGSRALRSVADFLADPAMELLLDAQ